MLDILLSVLLGVLTLVTAYFGVHVTLHPVQSHREKWAYKIGFTICGLAACVLIGIQTYRNSAAQQRLQAEVTHIQNDTVRIERNTEQPPKVQVNVPPPSVVVQPAPSVLETGHSATKNQTKLRSLSNTQLRAATLALAKSMRDFERNAIEQSIAFIGINGQRERAQAIYSDNLMVYNNTLLVDAVAFREELWKRVGAVNITRPSEMEAFQKLPDNLTLNTGHTPIANAATYLEVLANKLPNDHR